MYRSWFSYLSDDNCFLKRIEIRKVEAQSYMRFVSILVTIERDYLYSNLTCTFSLNLLIFSKNVKLLVIITILNFLYLAF